VALLDSPVGDPLTVPNLMLAEAAAGTAAGRAQRRGRRPGLRRPKNLPMLLYELHRDDPSPAARAEAYSPPTASAARTCRRC
jgi:asparagine synthase (glutamine-hydrolysing)